MERCPTYSEDLSSIHHSTAVMHAVLPTLKIYQVFITPIWNLTAFNHPAVDHSVEVAISKNILHENFKVL